MKITVEFNSAEEFLTHMRMYDEASVASITDSQMAVEVEKTEATVVNVPEAPKVEPITENSCKFKVGDRVQLKMATDTLSNDSIGVVTSVNNDGRPFAVAAVFDGVGQTFTCIGQYIVDGPVVLINLDECPF